jgi:hypothetical protein
MSIIPELQKMRQLDHKFEGSLGKIVRPCQGKKQFKGGRMEGKERRKENRIIKKIYCLNKG